MQTLKDFFARMHAVDFYYVVLRNWENLPYDCCLGEHSDLDILCYDFNHFKEIFPMATSEYPYPRVRMKIPIGESYFYCDVRHIGDGYYPEDFGRAILVTREWNPKGFFTPNPVHHRVALAYHAVHHKNFVDINYEKYLGNATVTELLESLKNSPIGWDEPKDPSVGRFNGYWKGCTSVVSKQDGRVLKKQVAYSSYNLVDNEWEILSLLNSEHFPKVYSFKDGVLELEDCGVPLLENVPEDWEKQLDDILNDLHTIGVTHRDIRLDNLLVKDGIIKLIDFGWAVVNGKPEEKEPPSCLGFPNKPSWGFDDAYSMRIVKKQITYHLEERNEDI